MEYISSEEFLNQDEKVQKVFIDWWKPSIGDLFSWIKKDNGYEHDLRKLECCNSYNIVEMTNSFKGIDDGDRVPLLTEGTLRKFIEDKTGCKIIINIGTVGYQIVLMKYYNSDTDYEWYKDFGPWEEEIYFDLLQVYWKVACEIAKGE